MMSKFAIHCNGIRQLKFHYEQVDCELLGQVEAKKSSDLRCMKWLYLVGLILLWGCTSTIPTSQSAAKKPYDWEARLLHPELTGLRMSPDSAAAFIRLDRAELLYLRETTDSPFVAEVEVKIGDKLWTLRDTLSEMMPQELNALWRVRIDELQPTSIRGEAVELPFLVRDVFRNADVRGEWTLPSAQRTINLVDADGWPLPDENVAVGDTIYLQGPGGLGWIWSIALPEPTMPSPPFTSFSDPMEDLEASIIDTLVADELGRFALVVPAGTSLLQSLAFDFEVVVHGRRPDFPFVRSVPYLIESSRYITSRSEYERMTGSEDCKGALDGFWLDCGNDKDRGANLIDTYYGRVEEANRYFSGLQEGWRTDRGMVHIVFGVPNKVRRLGRSEWWIYGEEGNANTITFSFRHSPTLLDPNRFVLDRSIQFRPSWDRMVTSWRNGRVQGD